MTMKTFILLSGIAAVAFGCQSTGSRGNPPIVRDRLLAYVPEAQQENVHEARRRQNELQEQLSAAKNDLAEVDSLLNISREDIDVMRQRMQKARDQVDHTRQFGTDQEFQQAQTNLDQVEEALRYAQSQRKYNEDMREYANRRIDLLQERIELAEARLELAKARAVSTLDRPVVDDIDVDEHRYAVEREADDVENARIEALAARERLRLRHDFVQQSSGRVSEALRLRPVEPMDRVFEADAFEDRQVELSEDEMRPAVRRQRQNRGNAEDASMQRPNSQGQDRQGRDTQRQDGNRDGQRNDIERRDGNMPPPPPPPPTGTTPPGRTGGNDGNTGGR